MKKEEDEAPFPLPTHVIKILHSMFSKVEVYNNTQQNYYKYGSCAHTSFITKKLKGTISQ